MGFSLFRESIFLSAARTNEGLSYHHFQQNNHDATSSMFIKGGVGERSNDSSTLASARMDNVYAHSRGMMQHLNALLQRRISTRAMPQVFVVGWGIRTFYVCASHLA